MHRDRAIWPLGASLTEATLIVIRLAVGSRSTPPLAVPPSSCTWKVKLAYGVPLALAAPVKVQLAGGDVGHRDELADGHRQRHSWQRAGERQRGDANAGEACWPACRSCR